MKLAAIILSILVLTTLIGCAANTVDPVEPVEPTLEPETGEEPVIEDVELVAEDEVDIGELI